jgi:hypothetical protein
MNMVRRTVGPRPELRVDRADRVSDGDGTNAKSMATFCFGAARAFRGSLEALAALPNAQLDSPAAVSKAVGNE